NPRTTSHPTGETRDDRALTGRRVALPAWLAGAAGGDHAGYVCGAARRRDDTAAHLRQGYSACRARWIGLAARCPFGWRGGDGADTDAYATIQARRTHAALGGHHLRCGHHRLWCLA